MSNNDAQNANHAPGQWEQKVELEILRLQAVTPMTREQSFQYLYNAIIQKNMGGTSALDWFR